VFLSGLARLLPWMRNAPYGSERRPQRPHDPFDPDQVRRWQTAAQSPAGAGDATPARRGEDQDGAGRAPFGATPVQALTLPHGPGPEGLAEQFAFKFVAGVFNRDISDVLGPAGMATHLAYGSSWGLLFGLLQATYRRPAGLSGVLYGLLVWLVGPAALVPAMRLLRKPWEESPQRTGTLLGAHIAYGLALAGAFEALERARRGE
jgi:hypothetical protein